MVAIGKPSIMLQGSCHADDPATPMTWHDALGVIEFELLIRDAVVVAMSSALGVTIKTQGLSTEFLVGKCVSKLGVLAFVVDSLEAKMQHMRASSLEQKWQLPTSVCTGDAWYRAISAVTGL